MIKAEMPREMMRSRIQAEYNPAARLVLGFGEGAAAGQRSARPQGTSLDGRPPVLSAGALVRQVVASTHCCR